MVAWMDRKAHLPIEIFSLKNFSDDSSHPLMNSMIRILKNMSMTFYSTEPKTHTHKRISSRIDRMMEDTYRRLVDRTRD